MLRFAVRRVLDDGERASVVDLVNRVHQQIGRRPLSDRAWLELVHVGSTWHAAVLCHQVGGDGRRDEHAGPDGQLLAVMVIGGQPGADAATGRSWTVELVVDPTSPARHAMVHGTLAAARDEIAAAGGGDLTWWMFDVTSDSDDLATSIGLRPDRSLLQMQVGLPLPAPASSNGDDSPGPSPVTTRPFEVGRDEAAWLEVNNAAFAWHPEQGNWQLDTLELREREDWFDPSGFLLHERDGRLAAFCWTKLHLDADPVIGEIYVIAVHPDFHGLGLGRALTVAGLHDIASRGITTGMLFVDEDNTSAVALYESLGFHVHRTDRSYVGHIGRVEHLAPTHDSQEQP